MSCIASCYARRSDRQCWSGMVGRSHLQGSAEVYLLWPTHPPSFTRLFSGTAKGTSGRARRHSGLLLSRTPSPKRVWVPFPQSSPWHLGAAIPRVRPG